MDRLRGVVKTERQLIGLFARAVGCEYQPAAADAAGDERRGEPATVGGFIAPLAEDDQMPTGVGHPFAGAQGPDRRQQVQTQRDPLRAPSGRLRVELASSERGADSQSAAPRLVSASSSLKLNKPERELKAFLELHPGSHNLKDLESTVPPRAPPRARWRERGGLPPPETAGVTAGAVRTPHGSIRRSRPPTMPLRRIQRQAVSDVSSHGVTGSGKTEVYLNAIEAAWHRDAAHCCWCRKSRSRRHGGPVLFPLRRPRRHSAPAFTDVDAPSSGAASAPARLGGGGHAFRRVRARAESGPDRLDEEHDGSYKQEETPRYNGRDVALVRAQAADACVVLGSATPSLESRYNVERGKYTLLTLPGRIEARPMPEVQLIDMRQEFLETRQQATFSRKLVEAIGQRLDNGEQTIILLNRRGFSNFVACRSCGERVQCANCSLTLTFHKRDRRLLCHYCGYAEKSSSVCPKCSSEHVYFLGVGSERVEEELHRAFPPRASPASTATRLPANGSTKPSSMASAKAVSTSWSAHR